MVDPAECAELEIGNQGLQVRMPGGATLQVMVPDVNPSDIAITKSLLSQGGAALAPLIPVFNLIDAMLAVKDFAEAVPGLITDPSALVSAIEGLIEKIAKLAQLVPQLSVPFLVVDLIDVGITALNGFVTQLEAVVAQEIKIAAAIQKANDTGNAALLEVTVCATDINAKVKQGISEGLGPLNSFFGVLSLFLQLIGQAPIPSIDELGDDAQGAIDVLRGVVDTLSAVRDAIPVP